MFLFWEVEIYNPSGNQAALFDYLWTSGITGKVILSTFVVGRSASETRYKCLWYTPCTVIGVVFSSFLELCTVMYSAVYTDVREESQKSLLLLLLKLSFAP